VISQGACDHLLELVTSLHEGLTVNGRTYVECMKKGPRIQCVKRFPEVRITPNIRRPSTLTPHDATLIRIFERYFVILHRITRWNEFTYKLSVGGRADIQVEPGSISTTARAICARRGSTGVRRAALRFAGADSDSIEYLGDDIRDALGEERWNGVAHLRELMGAISEE